MGTSGVSTPTFWGKLVFQATRTHRSLSRIVAAATVLALVAAACGDDDDADTATDSVVDTVAESVAPQDTEAASDTTEGTTAATDAPSGSDPAGTASGQPSSESLDADPALLQQALGTSSPEGVPDVVLAGIARAGAEVTPEMLAKALECWDAEQCDTGTGVS